MEKDLIGYEVRTLDNLIMKNMYYLYSNYKENACREPDATVMHGYILGYLNNHQDSPVYQKNIEKEFCINKSTVTNILKLMEKKGYIRRQSVESDARLKQLVLTEEGRRVHDRQIAVLMHQEQQLRDVLTEEEFREFIYLTRKLKSNLLKAMNMKEEVR